MENLLHYEDGRIVKDEFLVGVRSRLTVYVSFI